jgi:UDP-GlcNAc:undecaprenyl-phosphate GlcNAc-1-phosphate transferase
MSLALQQAALAFVLTLILIRVLGAVAPRLRLVDEPDHRKQHTGSIPVVGGISILLTLIIMALVWRDGGPNVLSSNSETLLVFLSAAAVLTALGVIDDMRGVSVFTRTLVEVAVALIVIEGLDLVPRNLGDLIGTGNIRMPDWIAYPFTVIAIFGVINAYNMLDGIDGLLSIMVLITIFAFHVFSGLEPGLITLTLAASISAFLVSNLRLSPYIPKTFLGDAGSKLLGFIVVSLILAVTSAQVGGTKYIEPVTALYLVGLPLFDMVFTAIRRVWRRKSPFAADRSHIHHLMQDLAMSHRRSLVLIGCAGLALPFIGLMLNHAGAATPQQFFIFMGLFVMYCLFTSQAWRVALRLQALKEDARRAVSYSVDPAPLTSTQNRPADPDDATRITH